MCKINLYLGDCLVEMNKIKDKSVDLVLADLPYGSTKAKWDVIIPLEPLWNEYKRIIKKNGGIILFGNEPFSSLLRVSNIKWYKYDWTWNKVTAKGHLVAKKRPMQQTENVSVFGRGKINYFPIMEKREKDRRDVSVEYSRSELQGGRTTKEMTKIVRTERYPKTILTFSNASQKNKNHPTEKPIPLLEYLIKTYTLDDMTVLDNTMGSGSTGVAAKNLGRNFIGIEKDEKYFNIACLRLGISKV